MNNKIEYQIFFEINENLKIVSKSLNEYTKAVEYATNACVNFGNGATDRFMRVSKYIDNNICKIYRRDLIFWFKKDSI